MGKWEGGRLSQFSERKAAPIQIPPILPQKRYRRRPSTEVTCTFVVANQRRVLQPEQIYWASPWQESASSEALSSAGRHVSTRGGGPCEHWGHTALRGKRHSLGSIPQEADTGSLSSSPCGHLILSPTRAAHRRSCGHCQEL